MFKFLGCLWAAPATLLGLLLAPLALCGGSAHVNVGVIEIQGGQLNSLFRRRVPFFGNGAAMTLGHVILARNQACMESSRGHERVHVQQFERWGVFLFPAYVIAGLIAKHRGLDPHLHNTFEQEAYNANSNTK